MTCDDRRLLLRSAAAGGGDQSRGIEARRWSAAAAVASTGLTGISGRRSWQLGPLPPFRLSFLFLAACVTLMACRPCHAAPPHVDSSQQHQQDIDDEDGK